MYTSSIYIRTRKTRHKAERHQRNSRTSQLRVTRCLTEASQKLNPLSAFCRAADSWEQFDIKGLKSTDLFVVLRLLDRT